MIRLALDTSTMTQTVAVSRGAEVVDATRFVLRTGHSPDLARTIGQMLSRQGLALPDVDELVVGVGPGSFTGLRIGLALAKGIAAVHGQPIVPVPSFLACAALLPPGGRLAVAVDARKRQVYAACMETGLPATLRVPVGAYPPADFAAAVHADADARPLWFCGSGFDVYVVDPREGNVLVAVGEGFTPGDRIVEIDVVYHDDLKGFAQEDSRIMFLFAIVPNTWHRPFPDGGITVLAKASLTIEI